jgi:single-stranded DNA-binding protein
MIDTMSQTVHTYETAAKLLCHGQLVFVSGELSQSEFKADDGATKTSLELNATIVDLIGKKSEGEANTYPHPITNKKIARAATSK